MNVKFNYCYRDGANYKNHGALIFSNNSNLALQEIERIIKRCLISEEFFYADQFNVPDLHFEKWNNEFDHTWHEFKDIEETYEPNDNGDIVEFLQQIQSKFN